MLEIREKLADSDYKQEKKEFHELKMTADTYNTLYKTTISMIDLDNLTRLDSLRKEMDLKITSLAGLEKMEFDKHW